MIDFKATHAFGGYAHFCNSNGDSLKQYPLLAIELYARDQNLDLDADWYEVTEKFYNLKNSEEFKSGNSIYPYGKQGLYNVNN